MGWCQMPAQPLPKRNSISLRPQPAPQLLGPHTATPKKVRLGLRLEGSLVAWMEKSFTMVGMVKHQYKQQNFQVTWQKSFWWNRLPLKVGFLSKSLATVCGNQGDQLLRLGAPLNPHYSALCRRTNLGRPPPTEHGGGDACRDETH